MQTKEITFLQAKPCIRESRTDEIVEPGIKRG
jgi:hypothetical protein